MLLVSDPSNVRDLKANEDGVKRNSPTNPPYSCLLEVSLGDREARYQLFSSSFISFGTSHFKYD